MHAIVAAVAPCLDTAARSSRRGRSADALGTGARPCRGIRELGNVPTSLSSSPSLPSPGCGWKQTALASCRRCTSPLRLGEPASSSSRPSTRLVLLGVLLVVVMIVRPQGLLGAARGDRLMAQPLLELASVSKAFGGLQVHRRARPRGGERRDRERHRPERRRQDDALQPRHRRLRARRGRHPLRRREHRRARRRTRSRRAASRARSRRCGCS